MRKTGILILIAKVILTLSFLFFGITKFIISPEQASGVFGEIGGVYSQYITGIYEVISAILIAIPSTTLIGAVMIMISMAVAFILHLTVIGYAGEFAFITILSIVFFLMALYVFRKSRHSR